MQKTKWFRAFVLAGCMVMFCQAGAQVTIESNNPPAGSYVGHVGTNGNPVEVRHNGNQPIQWFTDSIQRMQLYRSQTNTINGFGGIRQNGYLGISQQPLFFTNTVGPFSRLHLVDSASNNASVYAQQIGFRPWQRNGITMTGNSDQCYIGQKYNNNQNDNSDLVLQWSDNPANSPWGTDRLRFLFTSWSQGANYGARSTEGLESFRIYVPNNTSAFVGIGDFYRASVLAASTVDPTERLDVLDRTVRIRRLPPDYRNDTLTRVVMVDTSGRLHWRHINTWPSTPGGAADCDWAISSGGSFNHVYTAVGPADPDCPDATDAVGIGVDLSLGNASASKLDLFTRDHRIGQNIVNRSNFDTVTGEKITVQNATGTNVGLDIDVDNPNSQIAWNYGIQVALTGPSSNNRGVQAISNGGISRGYGGDFISLDNAQFTHGVAGYARNGVVESYGVQGTTVAAAQRNNGVFGQARPSVSTPAIFCGVSGYSQTIGTGQTSIGVWGTALRPDSATWNFGVRGSAATDSVGAQSWAGYFEGSVNCTGVGYFVGGNYVASDQSFKTNIENLEDPAELIMQLQPRQYQYLTDQYPTLGFRGGTQAGFIAQELEEVLPSLVDQAKIIATYDTLGNEISPEISFEAVNYAGLIPYLVGMIQTQQGALDEQVAASQNATEEIQELHNRMDQLEQLLPKSRWRHARFDR